MDKIATLKRSFNLYNYLISLSLIARNNKNSYFDLAEIKDFFEIKDSEELIDLKDANSANIIVKILEKLSPDSFESSEVRNKYSSLTIKNPNGENVFRIDINHSIEKTELAEFESFYNSVQNYLYLFFYQDAVQHYDISQKNIEHFKQIISDLDIWHGNITFKNKIQQSILIEDASNDPSREYFKTIIKSKTLTVEISALNLLSGNAITIAGNQEAFLIINKIIDLKNSTAQRISYSIELKTQKSSDQINQSTVFSTKVFEESSFYTELKTLYSSLEN